MTMNNPTIGTISHGTHRSEDLLEAFASELRWIVGKEAAAAWPYLSTLTGADDCMAEIQESDNEPADAQEIICELIDFLSELAPPYCYFGAHPGDGSDFGFWPDFDAIESDGIPRVGDASELPDGYVGEWALANDHGNVTLYTRVTAPEDVAQWDCV